MLEYGLQPFQFQGRGDAEHAPVAVEAAVSYQNVAVGIESEKIAKGLNSDDGAGNRFLLRDGLLEKDLKGIPGASAVVGKEFSIV